MALINRNRLFVDVELNRAYSQFGSFSTAPQPFFIQGDQCPVEISLVRQTGVQGNPFEQVPFDYYSSCELKIGTIATGIATTASGSVVSSPNVNVTAILPYAANSWQVYRIDISPFPLGGFFTLTDGANYTQPIPVSATALELQNFIAAWGSTYSSSSVKVEKIGQFTWEVSFLCNTFGASVSLVSYSTGLIAFDSRLMTLDMTTAGVDTLLYGASQVEAILDFSVTVSGQVQTFLYTPCTVINDI